MIWLEIAPEPWRRTRGSGRHRFTDEASRAFKEELGYRLRAEYPEPLTGWLSVDVVFYPDGIRLAVHPLSVPRPRKADLDNYLKALADAGNQIVWGDDRQLTAITARFSLGGTS